MGQTHQGMVKAERKGLPVIKKSSIFIYFCFSRVALLLFLPFCIPTIRTDTARAPPLPTIRQPLFLGPATLIFIGLCEDIWFPPTPPPSTLAAMLSACLPFVIRQPLCSLLVPAQVKLVHCVSLPHSSSEAQEESPWLLRIPPTAQHNRQVTDNARSLSLNWLIYCGALSESLLWSRKTFYAIILLSRSETCFMSALLCLLEMPPYR